MNRAIEDYIHRENLKKVMALEGTIDDFMAHEELIEMRQADSLIDTSAWIDYFKTSGNLEIRQRVAAALKANHAAK